MFDWVGDSLEVLWRNMMWGIMQFSLNLQSGFITEIILPASKLTFLKSDIVNESYQVFSQIAASMLVVLVLFFLLMAAIRNEMEKKIKNIVLGALISVLLIVGTKPFVLWAFEGVSEAAVMVTTGDEATSLDEEIVRVTLLAANPDMGDELSKEFVTEFQKADFDYNVKVNDKYKYELNPFPTLVISFIVLFLLIYIALQILFRGLQVAFLLVLSPFAATTVVGDNNQGWKYITSQQSSNLLLTALQIWILLFSMTFITEMKSSNFFLQLLVLIVGLLFVIQAPSIVSGITGGTQGSLLQTAQSALMGANAGRAMMAGSAAALLATAGGIGNMVKGGFTGRGQGMAGLVGNAVSSPVRFASGALRGDGKTMFGNEGTIANKQGSKARNASTNFMQGNGLKPTGANDSNTGSNGSSNQENQPHRASSNDVSGNDSNHSTSNDGTKVGDVGFEGTQAHRPSAGEISGNDTSNSAMGMGNAGRSGSSSLGDGAQSERSSSQEQMRTNAPRPDNRVSPTTELRGYSRTESNGNQGKRTVQSVRQSKSANHRLKATKKNDNL